VLKFATCTTSVRHEGGVIRIQIGDAWHATDPFVRSHPDLFADQPVRVFGTPARRVESATSAPGETRGTKRTPG
jgi:hypothetical protein